MQLGIVGTPNCGKSSFFSAATLIDVEIANFAFTTIKRNKGMTYVKASCPHLDLKKECNPNNSKCINGTRLIPTEIIDVAGLVPNAHKNVGMGNQFLSDLSAAKALIHVIDISGSTTTEGKSCEPDYKNVKEAIEFLDYEIEMWILGILKKTWDRLVRKVSSKQAKLEDALIEQLSFLGITDSELAACIRSLSKDVEKWSDEEMQEFVSNVRKINKPTIIAANKIDLPTAPGFLKQAQEDFPNKIIMPCSAQSELALRKASEQKLINYIPGSESFKVLSESINPKQKQALEYIQSNVLGKHESTGIQKIIDKAAFDLLNMIVVYPVQDQSKWTDQKGNILPDAFLVKENATALDLAYTIHSDIGAKFIGAINARTNMKLGKDYVLKPNDVIKILTRA